MHDIQFDLEAGCQESAMKLSESVRYINCKAKFSIIFKVESLLPESHCKCKNKQEKAFPSILVME